MSILPTPAPSLLTRQEFSRLVFARDGLLFITLGDRFSQKDQAQVLDNTLGKVVRIERVHRAAVGQHRRPHDREGGCHQRQRFPVVVQYVRGAGAARQHDQKHRQHVEKEQPDDVMMGVACGARAEAWWACTARPTRAASTSVICAAFRTCWS